MPDSRPTRTFTMIRLFDETGVSGTGPVVEGVVFPDGQTVIWWNTEESSTTMFKSFEVFQHIHVDSHEANRTQIQWHDGETVQY